ncbi:splicing factor, arginine/serine-rich 4/5/6 [Fistulifera solaris]|uniref:Splicing factor, arginine/serine-rich 4/5/6 n=1 Tax=Fistulifera solaris TaxID=1519565 RepID=A0A1Z5J6R2_FISSO|nr:splicing factor, arginine/serine-rich 4/5/6 [Fistulifera solaris]|eukprot:GAX09592.1 splicing factor, arginine/serine-rich 4/5/6 [Fistulifera solaris]
MDSEENQPSTQEQDKPEDDSGEVQGSLGMRPVFLGNLVPNFSTDDLKDIFEKPVQPKPDKSYEPIPVDRVDQKRGYCFIFLKDATSPADKERIENFISDLNGMDIPNVSKALRVEFARGDGRVKRKEDERRKNIEPSDTLFVVNFHEETTRQEDLEFLFQPFGELLRIDMKRNYAFVQFKTVEQATKAKETTNGGKLDQAVLTVEYVARQRDNNNNNNRRRRDRGDDRRHGRNDRLDNRRRLDHGPPRYNRRDSPPPYRVGRRSRSRSRSPPYRHGYRSRSPPHGRYEDRYDDFRDRRGSSPPPYRGRSPDRDRGRDFYRDDRERDRGYRG